MKTEDLLNHYFANTSLHRYVSDGESVLICLNNKTYHCIYKDGYIELQSKHYLDEGESAYAYKNENVYRCTNCRGNLVIRRAILWTIGSVFAVFILLTILLLHQIIHPLK